jgi:hypothetical protein
MKILAIEKEIKGTTAEDFKPHLDAEALMVWNYYKKGVIREIYFRADKKSAVLIIECKNVEKAEEVLSTLPLVRKNLVSFEIIPLVPYPGFERLFKKEQPYDK